MKKYLPVEGQGANNLIVEVKYTLGGVSFATYREYPRGYYLHVTPVLREEFGEYASETFKLFGGAKMLLKEVKRQSKKAEQEALAEAQKMESELINFVLQENNLTLI